ncbi:MBL fold metallo-hydrolase [Agromyces aerolatus]|uniref:MBL fold metallo-hydrolase n=1 Tax=Agromyces sp. LY-1074 TaxID=3074080 RepID=UPI00285C33DA|nr:MULTISPECIES: MBL fold metallo-hydrolase [unclassified Agromyces]MDR5699755.1 MBL fold metallo-hydrolase [Agromyces sp. LY-1074]MDR5706051.1 MBL fold metallo-hydrolase [Agromyces sp. LY-1358]
MPDSPRHEWARPGAFEVAKDVFRIPLPMPTNGLRAVSAYAVRSGRDLVLVDSGWAIPEAMSGLGDALGSIGAQPAHIREFVITHAHGDHYSLAVQVRERHGTSIAIGAGEEASIRAVIANWDSGYDVQQQRLVDAGAGELAGEFGRWRAANPRVSRLAEEYYELPDRWLHDGETIGAGSHEIRAVATPGHTSGHLVYVDEAEGIVFSGDHVLPHITPSVGFEPVPAELALRDFLESLEAMLRMPDFRVMPAHGPVGFSLHDRSRELLGYHDGRLSDMQAAVVAGQRSALAVARRVGWTRRGTPFDDLDPFNRALALNETVAHLRLLVHRGELTAAPEADGTPVYLAA